MTLAFTAPICLAVPKGRIFDELGPRLAAIGIRPQDNFFDPQDRALAFPTNIAHLTIIRVRAFDVATFVAHGAAQLGVAGRDVTEEFGSESLYAPLDLGIGRCRLSLAEPADLAAHDDPKRWTHLRVATKYPQITRRYFEARGVQAECIHLNGAMELAPRTGLATRIVDLVSSGQTLRANGLVEVETLLEVTSRLIVNRGAYKTRSREILAFIDALRGAEHAAAA